MTECLSCGWVETPSQDTNQHRDIWDIFITKSQRNNENLMLWRNLIVQRKRMSPAQLLVTTCPGWALTGDWGLGSYNKWSKTTGGGIVMSNVTESIKMGSNDAALIKIILKWHFLLSLCDWGSWRKLLYQWFQCWRWLVVVGFSKNINLGQGRDLLIG